MHVTVGESEIISDQLNALTPSSAQCQIYVYVKKNTTKKQS